MTLHVLILLFSLAALVFAIRVLVQVRRWARGVSLDATADFDKDSEIPEKDKP